MAERQDQRSENQPSHDAQVKGGQQSQSGSGSRAGETQNSGTQNTGTEKSGTQNSGKQNQPNPNQPSHEAQVKGGKQSHSGSEKSEK
jgi:hypothetical protein